MSKRRGRSKVKGNKREAYAYIRVSVEEENPDNQRRAIENWCETNSYEIVEWFQDVGVSGAVVPRERPGFKTMLQKVNQDPKPIIIYELSRLGRSFYETFRAIQELENLNAPIITVSPKEQFLQSLDPEIRKLIIAILSWVAERERELLRQRTKEGMARAKAEGKHVGRPPKPIDWRRVDELRKKGVSYRDISKIIEVPYSTLLRRIKKRRD